MNTLLGDFISVRTAEKNFAAGENVGFAAEAADALGAPDECGFILNFHAREFFGSGAVFEESGQLFIDLFFNFVEIRLHFVRRLGCVTQPVLELLHFVRRLAGTRGDLNCKLPSNFIGVSISDGGSGDLIVVDQALVQAGSFSLG